MKAGDFYRREGFFSSEGYDLLIVTAAGGPYVSVETYWSASKTGPWTYAGEHSITETLTGRLSKLERETLGLERVSGEEKETWNEFEQTIEDLERADAQQKKWGAVAIGAGVLVCAYVLTN